MSYLKLVTARIGNRKDCQLNFVNPDPNLKDKQQSDKQQSDKHQSEDPYCYPTYILGYNGGESTELFRLYSPVSSTMRRLKEKNGINFNEDKSYCPILFQTDKGEDSVFVKSIKKEDEIVTVIFSTELQKKVEIEKSELDFVSVHNASERYWILYYRKNIIDQEKILIVFQLEEKEEKEQNSHHIQLCIAPEQQIRDIVIDFGSEASQIATFQRGKNQDTNCIEKTFSNMKNMLGKDPTLEDKNYVQYSSESLNLYRSIFYAKQDYRGDSDTLQAGVKCSEDDNDILRMFTTQEETQQLLKNGYIVLPTVKLSGFGGIPQPKLQGTDPILDFGEHFFYRKCLNNLLLSEFECLRQKKEKSLCVNVCLLIPNVFPPSEISEIVCNLRYDINSMIETEKLSGTIASVEINTVSESDASLIGTLEWLSSQESYLRGANQYLVMDAGKGTLDISVIKHDDSSGQYICRYRSGVLGAGNAITFAYMCALLYDFLSQNNRNVVSTDVLAQFIKNNIVNDGDRYLVNQMFDAIEKFKQKERKDSSERKVYNNKDLKNFNEFVEHCTTLSDEAKKWISATIDEITRKVLKRLEIVESDDMGKIDYVFYTGRAFRCKELKNSIQNAIRCKGNTKKNAVIVLNDELKELTDVSDYDKILCLYIRKAVVKGNCSENTLCLPFILHKFVDRNNNVEGVLDKVWNIITNKHPEIRQTFSSINTLPIVTSRYSIMNSTPDELYSRGMRLGFELLFSPTDKLFYNGYKYKLDNPIGNPIGGKIRLFVINGRIYMRLSNSATRRTEEGTCFPFEEEEVINLKSSPLAYGTFFPNVGMENKIRIVAPNEDSDSSESEFQAQYKGKNAADTNEGIESQFQD